MAEIIAKIGLDHARFDRGLSEASRGWEAWAQKVRRTPIEFVPAKSARDSARVFEDIERARSEHIGNLNRDRLERALATGAGAIGKRSGKSAAESASAFDALLPPLPVVERRANGILALLRRKFSATDIFKDAFRSVGLGLGVGAISERVVNVFRRGAQEAGSMADHTERMLDIQRNLESALRGPRRELELQVKQYNDLNRDIEDQKRLIESLKNPVLEFISPDYQQQVDQANAKLKEMVEKQASLGASAKIAANADKLRTEALQRQQVHANNLANIELRNGVEGMKFAERRRFLQEEYLELTRQGALPSTLQENLNRQKSLEKEQALFEKNQREQREDLLRTAKLDAELAAAELRDAGEIEKKQIRLNGLRRDYDAIKSRRGILSNEAEANRNEQRRLQNEIKIDQQKAQRESNTTLANIGAALANRNGPKAPRPRGRSEPERLADRAQENIQRAEEAVRKGQSPEYVASLTASAARDLRTVGGKVAAGTSKISSEDAKASGSSLLATNKILTEIKAALTPIKTNSGGAK